MKRFSLASITLGAALAASPALAQEPQTMGVLDAAGESLFGDVYAVPSTWRALPASTFFSEGWNEPWASPPPGAGGAPRQGWINAFDGVFYRLGIVTAGFADDVNDESQYTSGLTLYSPFSRRFEIQTDLPFLISNVDGDDDRHTRIGDLQLTPRFLISESESFTQSFNLGFRVPSGEVENGNEISSVTPTWNFWSNPWQGLVVRGGVGIGVPWGGFDAGARTSLIGNLAVGYYFTPHDRAPFGDFVTYLATNVTQPVDDRASDRTTVTLTPGFRTHLGANWYLLGGVEVPVTNPEPFDYQVIAGLMKVF